MNDDRRLIDELLHEMLERRARHGSPEGLRDTILASAAVVKPGRGTPRLAMPPLRLLAAAALLAALAGGGFLLAGQQHPGIVRLPEASVAPTSPMVEFIRPFDYRRSDEAVMGPPIHEGPLVGFTPGHSTLYPIAPGRRLLQGSRGVAIAPISERVLQRCPDDPELQPAGDVGVVEGIGVGGPTFRTIDGRQAEIVWPTPTMRCVDSGVDVVPHADVLPPSVGSGVMAMYLPSRMYVTTVDGEPIVFQVWASSDDELAAWLPDALRFLDGIHFTGTPSVASPSPAPSSTQPSPVAIEPGWFKPSFAYRPVEGVPAQEPILGLGIVAFVVGGPGAQTLADGGTPSSDMYPLTAAGEPLPGTHGIAISRLQRGTFVHGCPAGERVPVRLDQEGFVDDLQAVAGVATDRRRQTSFDGRPAIVVDVDPSRNRCHADFHTVPAAGLIPHNSFVKLNIPSRLVVTEVDGTTVVIQVWGATSDDLEASLPAATRFLDGIHFTGQANP